MIIIPRQWANKKHNKVTFKISDPNGRKPYYVIITLLRANECFGASVKVSDMCDKKQVRNGCVGVFRTGLTFAPYKAVAAFKYQYGAIKRLHVCTLLAFSWSSGGIGGQ